MRGAMRFLIAMMVSAALIWVGAGFVVLDWNVLAWAESSRASLLILSVTSACMFMAAEL